MINKSILFLLFKIINFVKKMEKYGTVFDKNFNLKRDQFRNLIVEYYQNPTLQKLKNTKTDSSFISIIYS